MASIALIANGNILDSKYERSKVLAIQLKANADQLEADNNMYKHQLKAQTASFEKLKKHAAEKLELYVHRIAVVFELRQLICVHLFCSQCQHGAGIAE